MSNRYVIPDSVAWLGDRARVVALRLDVASRPVVLSEHAAHTWIDIAEHAEFQEVESEEILDTLATLGLIAASSGPPRN